MELGISTAYAQPYNFEVVIKAPIRWVDAPLWKYDVDGWDDGPMSLGNHLSCVRIFFCLGACISKICPLKQHVSSTVDATPIFFCEANAIYCPRGHYPMADGSQIVALNPWKEDQALLESFAGCEI